ncbi:MAG: type I 3-dehydroquinate dehydratase [Candidatus Altiarchaeota archaeon]|nr:type I 3-dehydroquinate dehydratase [Candidatus Altiarchaeota archaeon]
MICVSLIESSVDSMVEKANLAPSEIIELRLDYLSDFSDLEALSKIGKRKIISCMPSWEGGEFTGPEDERVSILSKSLDFADFVTVELNTDPKLRDSLVEAAKKRDVGVIVAYHDFKATPPRKEIIKTLNKEVAAEADIAKVAFTAKNYREVLTLMEVLTDVKEDPSFLIPVIVVSMGHFGRISRILAPLLGSYLTYASVDKGKASAPGQLTFDELNWILGVLENERKA